MRLVLASSNAGKLAEFAALLGPLGVTVVAQGQLGVSDAEEPHRTFVENALAKARHAAAATGAAALADDSGLCVDALQGAPGVRSARWAADRGQGGGDAANNAALLRALEGCPPAARGAQFVCVLVALRHADDAQPLVATGRWPGRVAMVARGAHGFGYDPLFVADGLDCTSAELEPARKNALSHRGLALRQMAALMQQHWGLAAPVAGPQAGRPEPRP